MNKPLEDKDIFENLIKTILIHLKNSENDDIDSFESYHVHLQRNLYSTEKEYIDHFMKGYECLVCEKD
ncbi:MAG: hypothetical protein Q8K60_05525 [Parachlamydiaceae bacterium]|nr:hypothetical protein [Parachlamydiaceae bacterium]